MSSSFLLFRLVATFATTFRFCVSHPISPFLRTSPPLRQHVSLQHSSVSTRASRSEPWQRLKRVSERGHALHPHFHHRVSTIADFGQDLLDASNLVRSRVSLSPLQWDASLATDAAQHAQSLCQRFEHSSVLARHDEQFPTQKTDYIGENIYKVEGFNPTGTDVADAWYSEIGDYTYGPVGAACTRRKCAAGAAGAAANVSANANAPAGIPAVVAPADVSSGIVADDRDFLADLHAERVFGRPPAQEEQTTARSSAPPDFARVTLGFYGSSALPAPPGGVLPDINRVCMVGHFTQLLWHSSTKLGCGKAACSSPDGGANFAVSCRYAAGGNLSGELPFSSETARVLGLPSESCA